MAELGAFWGAGKPVLIYEADPGLDTGRLPPQFEGHFRIGSPRKLISDVKAEIAERAARAPDAFLRPGEQGAAHREIRTALDEWSTFFAPAGEYNAFGIKTEKNEELRAAVRMFLGIDTHAAEIAIATHLPYRFEIRTTTGLWNGFSPAHKSYANEDVDQYTQVLLLWVDSSDRCTAAAAAGDVILGWNRGSRGQ